jgi:alpha-D-ribose 1-methylphosphonate 5-triphosphate synthase subunit PhnH
MSAALVAHPYDPVFDGQKHYRTLLNCTARPGTIGLLDDVQLDHPVELNRATALVALALFGSEVSCYLQLGGKATANFLRQQTQIVEMAAAEADFLILDAKDAGTAIEALKLAKAGRLDFPENGATVILQIAAVSPAPLSDCLRLTLAGPGIETESNVFVSGVSPAFLDAFRDRNREFPVGVDLILTCNSLSAGPCILSLPRTTDVRWASV